MGDVLGRPLRQRAVAGALVHPRRGGGVAANLYLRGRLEEVAAKYGAKLVAPPVKLCTDNGAMIAWAGVERLRLGQADALDFRPRPRWPLDPNARPPIGV